MSVQKVPGLGSQRPSHYMWWPLEKCKWFSIPSGLWCSFVLRLEVIRRRVETFVLFKENVRGRGFELSPKGLLCKLLVKIGDNCKGNLWLVERCLEPWINKDWITKGMRHLYRFSGQRPSFRPSVQIGNRREKLWQIIPFWFQIDDELQEQLW